MISGIFSQDIEDYISNLGGGSLASIQSERDLSAVSQIVSGQFELGKMYTFRYITPDEKIYDMRPIILFLGYNDQNNLIGLNLHYFPLSPRIEIIKRIVRSYESSISVEVNSKRLSKADQQRPLSSFTYENLKMAFQQRLNILHGVRQYRLDRITSPSIIGYESWYIGVANDTDNFKGASMQFSQSLYYSNI